MPDLISHLSAHSKPEDFPTEFSDQVYYSYGCKFDHFAYQSVYSLKYVFEGVECYEVDGRHHEIRSGQFLVVNDQSPVTLLPAAEGRAISAFIHPLTLKEAFANLCFDEDQLLDDPNLEKNQEAPLFWENVFTAGSTALGSYLNQVFNNTVRMIAHQEGDVDKALFYRMAGELIKSQRANLPGLQKLDTAKTTTRQEVFHRLKKAQEYLHAHPFQNLYLEDLARVATLSPYHFHRSFVKVFGITPMRYQQQLKMEKAKTLLQQNHQDIGGIAMQLGFADASAFGKAFKRETGRTLGDWRKKK